jgi:hypothetical protein
MPMPGFRVSGFGFRVFRNLDWSFLKGFVVDGLGSLFMANCNFWVIRDLGRGVLGHMPAQGKSFPKPQRGESDFLCSGR